ncbi:Conserved_hypothetical protein [Hexamita inflata]|uniref:Uncharacterized protein n=1 Tax=Hexamita inflata TaxID=28002 RepID=A0AA86Q8F4_9EUKA|nr:Conserved hypothetical protein [Hexamita inflata]
MVEVVFENFVNYLRSGNTDKLNIISFQQNQQHKINLSTQLIFYRILTKTVVQLNSTYFMQEDFYVALVTIMRLYYISATALMNDMANLLGFIMQQLLENVNKHQEKKLRKQYQDDILDNTEDFSNEEQPEYIDSKMKGLLLNKLVKNEMYEDCAGFQTIDTVMGGGIAFSCLLCEQLYIKIFCHFQCG